MSTAYSMLFFSFKPAANFSTKMVILKHLEQVFVKLCDATDSHRENIKNIYTHIFISMYQYKDPLILRKYAIYYKYEHYYKYL